MLFNSIDFAIFFPVVFLLYWMIFNKNIRLQNSFLVLASYFFYGWWNWKFLSLIVFSTLLDFIIGKKIFKETKSLNRLFLLLISLFTNLGLLAYFKYYNFFLENFISAFTFLGYNFSLNPLNIILPVGISFYTFQTLSYTIDIYRKKINPCSNLITFAAFVSFFPQLVAGPIERAKDLIPQLEKSRDFSYEKAVDGSRQILWGLFKKVVIADNCAELVNVVYSNPEVVNGSSLFLAAIFFAFQIYGDFSGYSDIAIGTARLLGIQLKQNFAFPYFSRDIAEFWRRWHISLSSWFRDYVYIPLGGSRGTWIIIFRNTLMVFLLSALWHGANWTFIIWGFINALYFLPLQLSGRNRKNLDTVAKGKIFPGIVEILQILFTFLLTVIAWIFFRAENLAHALSIINGIFTPSLFQFSISYFHSSMLNPLQMSILLLIFIVIEWTGRNQQYAIEQTAIKHNSLIRYSLYYFIVFSLFWFGGKEQQFIYFQF